MNIKYIHERQEKLKRIIHNCSSDTVFIHSDLFRASLFIEPSVSRQKVINNQLNFLKTLLNQRDFWFPAFNYQFLKTKVFNVKTSISEVGPLSEYFRQYKAQWRTFDPIFSAVGTGENPSSLIPQKKIIAFSEDSIFAKLKNKKGCLLFYGAEFSSATIIHYAEQLFIPPYRYDKVFPGTIIINGLKYLVNYSYHVRPMGYELDYAWDKLLTDLQKDGIACSLKNNIVHVIPADILIDYWLEKLNEDPFYFLDENSKKWVIPKLDLIGRRFRLEDFE